MLRLRMSRFICGTRAYAPANLAGRYQLTLSTLLPTDITERGGVGFRRYYIPGLNNNLLVVPLDVCYTHTNINIRYWPISRAITSPLTIRIWPIIPVDHRPPTHVESVLLSYWYVVMFVCEQDIMLSLIYPDSKVHGANMWPTWVHVCPMNLAVRVGNKHEAIANQCMISCQIGVI